MLEARNTTHGLAGSAEYRIWAGMKKRCYNTRFAQYADYGGRGIVVCDRWRDDFPAFLADMGQRPTRRHSIDRIDNDGPYSPDNCQWVPLSLQSKNRRTRREFTLNGRTLSLADWTRELGLTSHAAILDRLRRGWSLEKTLSTTGDGLRADARRQHQR